MKESDKRAAVLRYYEADCYRICFYLLHCETLAAKAAERALRKLALSDLFYMASTEQAASLIKKVSASEALALRKQVLLGKQKPATKSG
ncbi:hypothetical protein [Paenibacillus turpanensis]|uniref:hypothetical protein n=1 Tax=Paenibacillus turpanensis TaxID=2689078 RepID=UPI00140879E0|nr:hypothetical protein [Paenibacillus turpanensis]